MNTWSLCRRLLVVFQVSASYETGLSINTKKTKVLKSNTKTRADLTENDQNLEEVDSFTYLGGEVDNLGG
jgi:hypothetical protein